MATHPQTRTNREARTVSTRNGFTLVELLIVIAIIAILAGLAFPAVQGAMKSGRKSQARNDVHQLAAAVRAFQLEYGRLPTTASGSDNTNADNASIIRALIGNDTTLNPRSIVFFEAKQAKGGKGGLDGQIYKDPWGKAYTFMLDTTYDNKIEFPKGKTNFATVIVSSTGPDPTDTNSVISTLK